MPAWRDKPKQAQNFLKRRSYAQGKAEADAAHYATQRLYCEALRFWRYCRTPACRRHRRCTGDPNKCLGRNFFHVPQAKRLRAQQQVIRGGPRRVPFTSHIEWTVRRGLFADLLDWPFTHGPPPEPVLHKSRDTKQSRSPDRAANKSALLPLSPCGRGC